MCSKLILVPPSGQNLISVSLREKCSRLRHYMNANISPYLLLQLSKEIIDVDIICSSDY